MVRPRQPAQRRDLEAGDAPALLPGNPVPIRLSSRLPSTRPVREIRLHFEKVTLTRQSCPFLRIHFRTARAEPEGRAGCRHVGLFRLQTRGSSTTCITSVTEIGFNPDD